ncbi:hypothetical protein [Clostridium tagluense]|uniref:Uncharacterized protein n=1 Tax=Clostridium tagluense TaxID=360422 RepID=A0A401USS4_9CLOT|nr:hypothetical protein [Clostridium tagluense]GCD12605.1 hypothetical protein Ctaglu_42280 [Clostridium tagluense]
MPIRKFYIITEIIVTAMLRREAYFISMRSSRDIKKSVSNKNIYMIKEISKTKYKMYLNTKHRWCSGQLI